MVIKFLVAFTTVLLLLVCQKYWVYAMEPDCSAEVKELDHDFVPPRVLEMSEERRLNESGLASWSFGDNPEVRRICIIGFERYNSGQRLNAVVDDPKLVEMVNIAIGGFQRPAISDFSDYRAGLFCGAPLGQIIIETGDAKVLIGVTGCGFYFGTQKGSSHQKFYSWLLAKALNDFLEKNAEKGIEKEFFEMMSGEAWLHAEQKVYDAVQRGETDEKSGHVDQ